jgi:hypothetical protein
MDFYWFSCQSYTYPFIILFTYIPTNYKLIFILTYVICSQRLIGRYISCRVINAVTNLIPKTNMVGDMVIDIRSLGIRIPFITSYTEYITKRDTYFNTEITTNSNFITCIGKSIISVLLYLLVVGILLGHAFDSLISNTSCKCETISQRYISTIRSHLQTYS